MAPKKRKPTTDEDDFTPELEVEPEAIEPEVEPEGPTGDDTNEISHTFEMGKMYIAGVDNEEEEESDGPSNIDSYKEMDEEDDDKLKKARQLLSGATADDGISDDDSDKDLFLEKANYDPSEEWALGD
jgi:hypothetical protein